MQRRRQIAMKCSLHGSKIAKSNSNIYPWVTSLGHIYGLVCGHVYIGSLCIHLVDHSY